MNLENILYYFTHHSESIIQWLFLAILLVSAWVIGRSIFGRKEAVASAHTLADGSEIQSFLQKILDQTTKLEGIKLEGLSPAAVGEVEAQVQALKKDLQQRDEEIGKLKGGDNKSAGEASALAARIKELEGKLAEYEILEDDIADLSLYKEENVRLRGELDKLKGTAPAAAAAAPAPEAEAVPPPPAPAPPQPTAGDDIVAEFAQAVSQDVIPSEPTPLAVPETGNPMADFENAMKLEKKMTGGEPVAAAPPAPAPVMTPPKPPPTPAPLVQNDPSAPAAEGDDLFAEFANPAVDQGAGLDTDKMMEEMAALVSMEPSKGSALHEDIDTEKMAQEATRLTKA